MYKDDELNRTAVSFTTGLKGHIPRIGNMVVVSASMTDWGQTGLIADIDDMNVWLSEPVDFGDEADSGQMYVVGGDGTLLGPYVVAPTDYAHCIECSLPTENAPKTVKEHGEQASHFIFGINLENLLRIRVIRVLPQSQNEIRIAGSIINDEVSSADEGEAPALGSSYPALDMVDSVTINLDGIFLMYLQYGPL